MQWVAALLLCPMLCFASEEWEWSKDVNYEAKHDVHMMHLSSGEALHIVYDGIPWETVDKWSQGRPLLLAYNAKDGVVLIDKKTYKRLTVQSGWRQHPIESLFDDCNSKEISRPGLAGCFYEREKRWDKELNRAYKAVIAKIKSKEFQKQLAFNNTAKRRKDLGRGKLDPEKALKESQRQWLKYREAQLKTIEEIVMANAEGRNELTTSIGQMVLDMTIRQVKLLSDLIEYD